MALTFNPELIEKIFISLTYFRTWVILFFFPVIVLCPDLAFNFFKSIFYPNPTDIIIYNEVDFKIQQKQIQVQQLKDVVSPFDDDKIKLKRDSEDEKNDSKTNKINITPKPEREDKKREKVKAEPQSSDRNDLNFKKKNFQLDPPVEVVKKDKKKKKRKNSDSYENEAKDKESKNYLKEDYNKVIVRDRKKDSVFEDMDFEMREGKFYIKFSFF